MAWNVKLWRFPGQNDEFPAFMKEDSWSNWLDTDWGKRWLAGGGPMPLGWNPSSAGVKVTLTHCNVDELSTNTFSL
jgi:hypothetical protein